VCAFPLLHACGTRSSRHVIGSVSNARKKNVSWRLDRIRQLMPPRSAIQQSLQASSSVTVPVAIRCGLGQLDAFRLRCRRRRLRMSTIDPSATFATGRFAESESVRGSSAKIAGPHNRALSNCGHAQRRRQVPKRAAVPSYSTGAIPSVRFPLEAPRKSPPWRLSCSIPLRSQI
jgi:hypothetical protein